MIPLNAVVPAAAKTASNIPLQNLNYASASPFAGMLQSLVQTTSSLDTQAKQAVTGMLSGSGVDVHEAMIATQKADMAFELALQVRNKAVGAYQQMMAMQF